MIRRVGYVTILVDADNRLIELGLMLTEPVQMILDAKVYVR